MFGIYNVCSFVFRFLSLYNLLYCLCESPFEYGECVYELINASIKFVFSRAYTTRVEKNMLDK